MALSIIKPDSRGTYRLVAEHDLYLDESQSRVIVVKDGEEVPKEAAFVLAGKGGTIPTRYADMLKALDTPAKVKDEVREESKPKPEPRSKVKPEPEPVKETPTT